MPGVVTCGRCGANLRVASLPINVHPPRASRAAKRWRRWFPTARYWGRFRDAVAGSLARIRITGWPTHLQTPGVLIRLIVPGWAQCHVGRAQRGRWFFRCYLGLLLTGLLFIGTMLGWVLLGLAVSLHAASVLDIVAADVTNLRKRLIYSGVALVLLATVLYYPAGHLVGLVASPQRFSVAAPPFAAGDVVLVNYSAYAWSEPRPGDVVYYHLSSYDVWLAPGEIYRLQGDRVDRILAKGGQKVTSNQGKLLIDGRPCPWRPINGQVLPEGLKVAVPEGCYLIIPSADAIPAAWGAVSVVPRARILGRVYWRNQPLWRFGPVR